MSNFDSTTTIKLGKKKQKTKRPNFTHVLEAPWNVSLCPLLSLVLSHSLVTFGQLDDKHHWTINCPKCSENVGKCPHVTFCAPMCYLCFLGQNSENATQKTPCFTGNTSNFDATNAIKLGQKKTKGQIDPNFMHVLVAPWKWSICPFGFFFPLFYGKATLGNSKGPKCCENVGACSTGACLFMRRLQVPFALESLMLQMKELLSGPHLGLWQAEGQRQGRPVLTTSPLIKVNPKRLPITTWWSWSKLGTLEAWNP